MGKSAEESIRRHGQASIGGMDMEICGVVIDES
jgi:hypothetical protein